jgi:hypothetical protein
VPISFRDLFLDGDGKDEQACGLAVVLKAIRANWPDGAKAKDIAEYAGRADPEAIAFKAALEQASGKPIRVTTALALTWRLKSVVDAPVEVEIPDAQERMIRTVMALRFDAAHQGGMFSVKEVRP